MTDKNKSLIAMVVDRSGSMDIVRQATIEGINAFIAEQKKVDGECKLYYTQFDTEYEVVLSNVNIQLVAGVNEKTYIPRGSTALYDAIAKTINEVGQQLAALPETQRPGSVIFVVVTDGEENASQEYRGAAGQAKVKEMIERQRTKYNWNFIYLAASPEAEREFIQNLGARANNTMQYAQNDMGTVSAFAAAGSNVMHARMATLSGVSMDMAAASLDFSDEQREEAKAEPKVTINKATPKKTPK